MSGIGRLYDTVFRTDRHDRFIQFVLAASFLFALFVPVVLGFGVCIATIVPGEAPTAEEWFERLVGVDPAEYIDVEHFTIQGFDFSHHFRFEYEHTTDLEAIIERNGLRLNLLASPLRVNGAPDWYTPERCARAYSYSRGADEITLYVDGGNKIAYLETIHE